MYCDRATMTILIGKNVAKELILSCFDFRKQKEAVDRENDDDEAFGDKSIPKSLANMPHDRQDIGEIFPFHEKSLDLIDHPVNCATE